MPNRVVDVIHEDGRTTRMTERSLEAQAAHGWRLATAADQPKRRRRRRPSAPSAESTRAAVLADVGDDHELAMAAYTAEADSEQPDQELLAALESVVNGASAPASADPTTVTTSEED